VEICVAGVVVEQPYLGVEKYARVLGFIFAVVEEGIPRG
jgi:hypothetical protein